MSGRKRIRPADFALSNPLRPSAARRLDVSSSLYALGLDAQTALKAHHSCVNALAVSPGEGTWLASGGDDQRVLLWDAHDSTDEGTGLANEPRGSYTGAMVRPVLLRRSVDTTDRDPLAVQHLRHRLLCRRKAHLLVGRAPLTVFPVELDASTLTELGTMPPSSCTTLRLPLRPSRRSSGRASSLTTPGSTTMYVICALLALQGLMRTSQDAVMGLSAHPSNPALFISASSDGTLRHCDTRTSPGCVGLLADRYGMNSVVHHPLTPDCFVYVGEDGHLALLDGRMAWGGETQKKLAYSSAVQRVRQCLFSTKHIRLTAKRDSTTLAWCAVSPILPRATFAKASSTLRRPFLQHASLRRARSSVRRCRATSRRCTSCRTRVRSPASTRPTRAHRLHPR